MHISCAKFNDSSIYYALCLCDAFRLFALKYFCTFANGMGWQTCVNLTNLLTTDSIHENPNRYMWLRSRVKVYHWSPILDYRQSGISNMFRLCTSSANVSNLQLEIGLSSSVVKSVWNVYCDKCIEIRCQIPNAQKQISATILCAVAHCFGTKHFSYRVTKWHESKYFLIEMVLIFSFLKILPLLFTPSHPPS